MSDEIGIGIGLNNYYPQPKIQDSGERREFDTGAVRDIQEGKGRFDLIPYEGLMRLAQHYENGLKKYGERNWEKGIPISGCINSAFRHVLKYIAGWNDEDHLAAIAWNVFAIMHFEKHIPQMQDIPVRREKESE